MTHTYRIRVSNRLGPALCMAFAGMQAVVVPRQTIIEGWLSVEELHQLLVRVEEVGVQLVNVQCAARGRPGHRLDPRRPATDR